MVLDHNGIVKSVHLWFDAEATQPLDKTLAKEIDEILAGKSVAIPRVKADEASKTKDKSKYRSQQIRTGIP